MAERSPQKTVYVLGAGFSHPARAPLQAEIVREILALDRTYEGEGKNEIGRALTNFRRFLEEGLCLDPERFDRVMLEDVFTPIDRCVLDGVSFRQYDVRELVELREQVFSLILFAIAGRLRGQEPPGYVTRFARYLVSHMRPRAQDPSHEPVSVLSTNWDSVLDTAIYRELRQGRAAPRAPTPNASPATEPAPGVLDYCCYIDPLDPDPAVEPGLWALSRGGFNVKLLKLHGSMNWLQCPRCQRLYAAFDDRVVEWGVLRAHRCPHCRDTKLKSSLILPTFLKDLTHFQLRLIWQNAAIELTEADRVVFIGYSLPLADYELRQLFARTIRPDAEIEVVQVAETDDCAREANAAAFERYRDFFGRRRLRLRPQGVEQYIAELTKEGAPERAEEARQSAMARVPPDATES